jgi:hypothetical protein
LRRGGGSDCLLYKRLHRALFELPEATASDRPIATIDARMLATILRGVANRSHDTISR